MASLDNNWSQSGGFKRHSTGGPGTTHGTLGTDTAKTGINFGNSAGTSGSLFGNSTNTNNTNNTNNLFGNSNSGQTSGLFGNSNTGKPTSSLFGNSNSTTSNLFGNSGQTSIGNSGQTSIGNSGQTSNLFGNSGQTSSNLFGSTSGSTNLNTSGTSNLFGNSGSTNLNSSGTSNLFGNTSGSVFSGTSNTSATPANPYNSDTAITSINYTGEKMPSSVTLRLFSDTQERTRKRTFLQVTKPQSLLGKLGLALKLFRPASTGLSTIKGLFTSDSAVVAPTKSTAPARTAPIRAAYSARSAASMKRLVIRSKPLNFHLIDADSVFAKREDDEPSAKRRNTGETKENEKNGESRRGDFRIGDSSDFTENKKGDYTVGEKKGDFKIPGDFRKGDFKKGDFKIPGDSTKDLASGYWCAPTIGELEDMDEAQLAQVEDFVIGRIGYGHIAYDHAVDLREYARKAREEGVLLSKILFGRKYEIGRKYFYTHPNVDSDGHESKDAIGFGVNVPATVTLEQVVPRDGMGHSDFVRYLKRQVGTEFVTYDPMTHKWVFRVKHFSVWGLVDDLAEGDTQTSAEFLRLLKRRQDAEESTRVREHAQMYGEDKEDVNTANEYARLYEGGQFEQEVKKSRYMEQARGVPGRFDFGDSPEVLAVKRGLVRDEIGRALSRYDGDKKDMEEEVEVVEDDKEFMDDDKEVVDDKIIEDMEVEPSLLNPLDDIHGHPLDYLKQVVSMLPADTDFGDIVRERAYEPEVADDAVFHKLEVPTAAVSRDWVVQLELANDVGSALNPMVTETPRLTDRADLDGHLFGEFNARAAAASEAPVATVPEVVEVDEDVYPNNIPRIVSRMMANSAFTKRTNGFPVVTAVHTQTFGDLCAALAADEERVLRLAAALFDEGDKGEGEDKTNIFGERTAVLRGREAFLEWLRWFNGPSVAALYSEHDGDALEQVFSSMVAGDMERAVECALASNNSHLASVLTVADANNATVRELAANQLRAWAPGAVPAAIRKIYLLLTGAFGELALPWNLELGVRLMYGDNSASVGEVIDSVDVALVRGDDAAVAQMLLVYKAVGRGDVLDANVLCNINVKIQWIVAKVLGQRHLCDTSFFDDTTQRFGRFLERSGLWKEAVYVYAHLANDETARTVLRLLVMGNIQYIKTGSADDLEDELVMEYKLPRDLINEAVAAHEEQRGDYLGQCRALVRAHMWTAAHRTICTRLGPESVLTDNGGLRNDVATLLSQFPKNSGVTDWNTGAAVYQQYLKLLSDDDDATVQLLLDLVPAVRHRETFKQRTAVAVMAKRVGDLALERFGGEVAAKVRALPVGAADKRYFEVRMRLIE